MTTKTLWGDKQPTQEGWYVYREHSAAPAEVVHAFYLRARGGGQQYGSPSDWPPAYGFSRPVGKNVGPLLIKRMHQREMDVEDGLGGKYLCDAATRLPLPIPLSEMHEAVKQAEAGEAPPRKKRSRKKVAPVADRGEGEAGSGGDSPVSTGPPSEV